MPRPLSGFRLVAVGAFSTVFLAASFPPPTMREGGKRAIEPLSPPLALIPGGEHVVGWDRAGERLKKAGFRLRGPQDWSWVERFVGGPIEDLEVGKRHVGWPAWKFQLERLPTTRSVTLAPFLLGRYEVSCREYRYYCEQTGRPVPPGAANLDNFPVSGVLWGEARDYCRWLSERTGRRCRLPTSDEWEVAAQGPERWTFPWGNEFPEQFSETMVDCFVQRPNAFGLYHLGWFVAEWCEEPRAGESPAASFRGGYLGQDSMSDIIYFCSYKETVSPDLRLWMVGFRLAADAATSTPGTTVRGE